MAGLKKWIQAACRSSVKAIPCGNSCFGIAGPRTESNEGNKNEAECDDNRSKLDSSFTNPCSQCQEPVGDAPLSLHCPPATGRHSYSLDFSAVQSSVITPLEVPEMELHRTRSTMDENDNDNDWETLSDAVLDVMYDSEIPVRSCLSWPAANCGSMNLTRKFDEKKMMSDQDVGCALRIHHISPQMITNGDQMITNGGEDQDCPESPLATYLSVEVPKSGYDNENENGNDSGEEDDDSYDEIAGWGELPQKPCQGKKYGVPKLLLTSGKGSSILSSYGAHSVRDNTAYEESSQESWRSSDKEDEREAVSALQLALYTKSIGNSLKVKLSSGVSSEQDSAPYEGDKDLASNGEEGIVGNVFHQLFQVDGVGIKDQGLVWDRSSCESCDMDSRAKTTASGWPSRSKFSYNVPTRPSSALFTVPWTRPKSRMGKNNSMCQECGNTWMDRSINWITCGRTSFDREVDVFVKHPRENIHRRAKAARGAARYQRRQKVLLNRLEVALKEENNLERQGCTKLGVKKGERNGKPECSKDQSCSEIDSASRGGRMLWPKLKLKLFSDLQRNSKDAILKRGSFHTNRSKNSEHMQERKIVMPLTAR